jgi:hypothetical protein
MFSACVMAGWAYVTSPISRLVAVEVVESLLAAPRQRTGITVVRVKAVVHVAVEAVPAVEPWACAKKDSADKPVRPIVAVGCAVIRSIVEVAIGAPGFDANADCDLSWAQGCRAEQHNGEG